MKKALRSLLFPIIGLSSLVWFLVRVIPKPSRSSYPCMRAAAPIASSFVLWLIGLFSSVVFFKKARRYLYESRYVLFSLALLASGILGMVSFLQNAERSQAALHSVLEGPNQPMGEGKGIHPGRVAWIHNPDATNINCKNTSGDYWFQDDNADQAVVNSMLSQGLQMLSGESTDAAAWDALFRNFNQAHGRGAVGYASGEKILVKINLNSVGWGLQNVNTSPQVVYALLNQLVNTAGVAQASITVGDPNITIDNPLSSKCSSAFPLVKFFGRGGNLIPPTGTSGNVFFSSDGEWESPLPQAFMDAAYMINVPVFKKHHRAGISLVCKNLVGSFTPYNSYSESGLWHASLPCPEGGADNSNGDYGVYRCFVDFMGHEDLGGKTVLYLVDGLWSSINWGHEPIKWRMAPFNNDWPSSLFLSQDPVAIESVGFDFLYSEFDPNHPTEGAYDPRDNHGPFPHYLGVDDHLHQAADSKNWPAGFTYDPEKDSTPLPSSMGTHEHWNNATDMKYSRNLGDDKGIELVSNIGLTGVVNTDRESRGVVSGFILYQNHPNPFNPATEIQYRLSAPSKVRLTVHNINGRMVRTLADGQLDAGDQTATWDGFMTNGLAAPSGVYLYTVTVQTGGLAVRQTRTMVLDK
jgi:hypothetical protein